ncbi:hypothetical protein EJD97_022039 [Solanum chilense]|uniref:F-box domain-containing protein n=1 Tax=Solanum chilense TaxID=4083 RepID=A0A6N2AUG2_SOLCI|nr:hypothetical protein EJD97_022039 [Solanum chilense]
MVNRSVKKLPQDVVICVLLRLPVKSLLRFKCISKILYDLILSNTFCKLHLKHTTTTKDEFILFIRTFIEEPEQFRSIVSFFSGDDNDNLITLFPDLDMSYLTSTSDTIFNVLIGPCNGLIVLTDSFIIVLLNPTTRKYFVVPPSPFGYPIGYYRNIEGIGFGFDSIANDYKISRLSDYYWDPPTDNRGPRDSKCEIYDLSIDSWRELDVVFPVIYYSPFSELFYKEAIHWFTIKNDFVILCFDISTEIFRTMEMPDACTTQAAPCYALSFLDEFLMLICYPYSLRSSDYTEDPLDIWLLKEYGESDSWIKKYTIRLLLVPIESPLTLWKNHLLLIQTRSGFLISYDLNFHEVKEFNLNGHPETLRVLRYRESLTKLPSFSEQGI